MSDVTTPSEEELEELTKPSTPAPGDEMPDPEPEVLDRAQKIINRAGEGQGISQFSEKPEEAQRRVERSETAISAGQKIRFLAHVLGGVDYEESYSVLGGRLVARFRTLTVEEENRLGELVRSNPKIPKSRQRVEQLRYALPVALTELIIRDGEEQTTVRPSLSCLTDSFERDYRAWVPSVSLSQYRILFDLYTDFRVCIDTMLERAKDRDFWPTPLSP